MAQSVSFGQQQHTTLADHFDHDPLQISEYDNMSNFQQQHFGFLPQQQFLQHQQQQELSEMEMITEEGQPQNMDYFTDQNVQDDATQPNLGSDDVVLVDINNPNNKLMAKTDPRCKEGFDKCTQGLFCALENSQCKKSCLSKEFVLGILREFGSSIILALLFIVVMRRFFPEKKKLTTLIGALLPLYWWMLRKMEQKDALTKIQKTQQPQPQPQPTGTMAMSN